MHLRHKAVKILLGKINIPNVYNWIAIFNEMATGCDVPITVTTVDDFRFVLSTCFEDAQRSRARTISYRWAVIGTSETHHGDIKAVSFKEKTQPSPAIKHLVFQRLILFFANSVVKTITLTPIAVLEPQSSRTSVGRPMVG